eukprot:m.1234820 g.1234820  ORF g.1234820 m.1234820 type:complete len:81 (-) comp24665_c0_seq47:852-1094(-)
MSEFRKQQKQQVVAETRLYKGPDGAHVAPAQLPARMTTGVGTPLWMAPELLRGDSEYGASTPPVSVLRPALRGLHVRPWN